MVHGVVMLDGNVQWLDDPGREGEASEEGKLSRLDVEFVLEEKRHCESRQAEQALHSIHYVGAYVCIATATTKSSHTECNGN